MHIGNIICRGKLHFSLRYLIQEVPNGAPEHIDSDGRIQNVECTEPALVDHWEEAEEGL